MLDFEAMFTNPAKAKVNVKVKAKAKPKVKAKAKTAAPKKTPPPKPQKLAPKGIFKAVAKVKGLAAKPALKIASPQAQASFATRIKEERKAEKREALPDFAKKLFSQPKAQAKGGFGLKVGARLKTKLRATADKLKTAHKADPVQLKKIGSTVKKLKAKMTGTLGLKAKRPFLGKLKAKPKIDIKSVLQPKGRIAAASGIMEKAIQTVAKKGVEIPKKPAAEVKAKAAAAVRPIAKACKCQTQPVITDLERKLSKCGYPVGAATALLAGLHDMNVTLEKAALQRLATHEHKTITAQHAFEHEVLNKLSDIAKQLPRCHPVRTRAHLAILRRA